MKSIIKIFFVATLVTLCFLHFSCKEDWLETNPKSFYAPENVYQDESGFEALLITMRKNLKGEHYDSHSRILIEHASSDLGVPGPQNDRTVKNFPKILTPDGDGGVMGFPSKLLNYAYGAIKDANVLISRIDNIEWDDENLRNQYLARAYFHRAYWYYRLVNSYGDVPWTGKEVQEPKLDYQTYSRWTILDKIQRDMEWAVQYMPETARPGATTKGAGNHLLAKIRLANLDFDGAINAATNVINGPYQLMTERFGIVADDPVRNVIWDLHRPDNVHASENTETILGTVDRYEDPPGAKTGGTQLARGYNPAWWHSRVKDSEGAAGTVAEGPQYDTLFRGNAMCRPTPYYLYEIWDYENDLRRSDINWVEWYEIKYNSPKSVDYGEPIDRDNFASWRDTFQHSFSFPHYKTFVPHKNPDRTPVGGNGDMYIFRLAETYLIRAEAYFWKNNFSDAAEDINKVRERAGATTISPGEVDINFIFEERARELFSETPRHGEMVRVSYIMAKNNINGYTLENFSQDNWWYDRVMENNLFFNINLTWGSQSYHLAPHNVLWPISSTMISNNTEGVINQNEGYIGAENNKEPLKSIEDLHEH